MKYASPKYEVSQIEARDIIMSGELSYTVNESKDESGNKVGDVVVSAGSIFRQYFD